jgi:hypothetical protein
MGQGPRRFKSNDAADDVNAYKNADDVNADDVLVGDDVFGVLVGVNVVGD